MLDGCVCGPTIRVRHDKNRTREFNGLSFSAFFLGSPLQAPKTAVAGMVRPCFPLSCPQQRRITASVAPRSVRLGRGVPTRSAGRCRVGSAFPRTTPLLWHKRSFGGTAEPSDIASSRAAAPALRSVWRVVSGRARSRSTRRPATHSGRCPASRAASSQGTVGRAPQPGSASRALKRSAPLGHATARPARRRGSVSRDVPPASRAGTAAALPAAHTPWLRPIVSDLQPVHPASAPFGGFAARLRGLGVAGLALRRVPRRGDWLTGQPSGSFRAAPDAGSGRAGQRGAGLRGTRAGSPPVLSSGPSSIRGTWAPLANPLKSPGLEMRASNGIACAV